MEPEANDSAAAPASTGAVATTDAGGFLEPQQLRRLLRRLLLIGGALILLRLFVVDPYGIPSGSMRPTLIEGDVVLVNKLQYLIRSPRWIPFTRIAIPSFSIPGFSHLERGDVVVFDYPATAPPEEGEEPQYVKRCAAIAGDTVQLISGRIRVNGVEVPVVVDPEEPERTRRAQIASARVVALLRDGAAVIVPFKGFRIALDSATAQRWKPWIAGEGAAIEYRNRIVFIDGLPATHYTFEHDYFFALGDNSSSSRDSRLFGFVPYDNLIGEVMIIYWSHDPDGGIRWSRIGSIVH